MLALGVKELSEEINETLETNPLLTEVRPATSSVDAATYSDWIQNQPATQSPSFEDYLIRQLGFAHFDSDSYVAACIVISCLDDKGYLTLSTQALMEEFRKQDIHIGKAKILIAIERVRQLEPAGVASTDLADCLKQQLHRYHQHCDACNDAVRICDHLDLLKENPASVSAKLALDHDSLETAMQLIKQLNPSLTRRFDDESIVYIHPDILLNIDEQNLQISLNPLINRHIEINQSYVQLLKRSKKSQDKDYLRKNLNGARWWMNALAQRNLTLLRVCEHIVMTQQSYFTTSQKSLKPLNQQAIADSLNLHSSTISRAIKDKTLQTPEGIISLSSLLARRIPSNNNNLHSNQSVKLIIGELIKNESSQTPLSDSKIVEKLNKRGIRIARRTVNKYREQLNIPASNLRRIK